MKNTYLLPIFFLSGRRKEEEHTKPGGPEDGLGQATYTLPGAGQGSHNSSRIIEGSSLFMKGKVKLSWPLVECYFVWLLWIHVFFQASFA